MQKSAFLVVASIFVAAPPALATDDQVLRAPAPDWVSTSELLPVPADAAGLVFVRRSDFLVHLDEQGQSNFVGYRIKILHPNALQLGNLSIAWTPSAGAPTVHVIRVHRAGTVIDVLENASFEILRREDQLEAASLDGILTAVLRVPDLRVGDELEVGLTVRASDPTLQETVSGILLLAPEPQPGRFTLGLSWDDGQRPNVQLTPDITDVAERTDQSIRLSFDNPSPLAPPNDAPPRYQWQRLLEYSDFADWPAISARFYPLYLRAAELGSDSPLREEARQIAAAHTDPLDRARAALTLVQQQVRYIYVGLESGNLTPATADETWQRRYGDCKGKTTLLLALLNELGIEAEAVLVNNTGVDDGFEQRLPNAGLFNHVLVRVKFGGRDFWMDGTLPAVAEPSEAPIIPYGWVLPLTHQGSTLQHLEWQPYDRPMEVNLFEIDARAGFDQPARITSTRIIRGINGLAQQVELSALTEQQLLNGMRQQATGDTWQTIDAVQWHYDVEAQASVLTISGTGAVDWDDESDGSKSLTLAGGGFNPPQRRVRPSEQNQAVPYFNQSEFSCHVTTVRLPEETRPTQWTFNTAFDVRMFGANYYRAFEKRDGAMRMVRGRRIEQREISAEDAARDNARLGSFDNSMARIEFDPARESLVSRSPTARVPATYEIDWTADNVPCLAPAAATN
ncbi:MAG: DUF3857 domain-containing transglutaminase family protein [Pseudomonadota bacterium]